MSKEDGELSMHAELLSINGELLSSKEDAELYSG